MKNILLLSAAIMIAGLTAQAASKCTILTPGEVFDGKFCMNQRYGVVYEGSFVLNGQCHATLADAMSVIRSEPACEQDPEKTPGVYAE